MEDSETSMMCSCTCQRCFRELPLHLLGIAYFNRSMFATKQTHVVTYVANGNVKCDDGTCSALLRTRRSCRRWTGGTWSLESQVPLPLRDWKSTTGFRIPDGRANNTVSCIVLEPGSTKHLSTPMRTSIIDAGISTARKDRGNQK